MKMQALTRTVNTYVRAWVVPGPYARRVAAHRSNAAQEMASRWGVPLDTLSGPGFLDAAYRQRQRNRRSRRR